MTSVQVFEELCSTCPPKLVFHVGQPVADGGHGEAGEPRDVHALLGAQIGHDVLPFRRLPETGCKLGLQDQQVLRVPV